MKKLGFLLLLWVCSQSLLGQDKSMTEAQRAQLMVQVNEVAETTSTIHTNFTQWKHLDFLTNDIETKGKMIFQAPDKVRWEYNNPYSYVVIFEGDQLHIDDGGKKSTIDMGSSALFQQMNELIVNSVKGNLFSAGDFDRSFYVNEQWNKVVFVPKDEKMKQYIAAFELLFHKETGMVHQVKLIEPTNDYTRIVFSDRTLNRPVDASAFHH
ncbi:outer membrane lipoprotein carrier protein LolA [Altibacter sp. HG106]|uniref:outer membrane lipoprotein carrier protein LolA n=1 Tax=Altibacter sp. HG106 TaxID=3023937 RepID=UPI002350F470|nr:outer membrane lipoprotein carrier protein LolA [Altibacter sp. HG106]MDC7994687.1 outer membrane lipoprotein carrier protein LolA [Altibacter sp. HG106]